MKDDTHKVTWLEVIDATGRAYVNMKAGGIHLQLQDNDRTLKVFTMGSSNLSPQEQVDPDAHITDRDEYLKAKQQRFAANPAWSEQEQEPRLTVEEVMEAYAVWHDDEFETSLNDGEVERLRHRVELFTKAAKP